MGDLLDTPDAGPAAVRGGVLRIAGYVAGVLVTVGSAAVLLRHLGVEDSGRYVLVLSIVTLAGGVTDAGLSSIGVRELSLRSGADRRRFMRNLLGLRIAFTLAGIALACLYALGAGLGEALVAGTAIAGAGVLAQNLQSTYATSLMAELRLGWVTVIDLARQVATAIAIVALAAAGAGLVPFFVVAPAAGLLALALTARLVRGSVPLRPAAEREQWRELLAQTLPFALAAAVGAIYFRLAILLVDLLSTDRQTGLFGASFRIVEVLVVVPQLMLSAALPIFSRAARDDAERLRYGLGLVAQASLIAGGAVAVGLVLGAPVAIDVVAGPDFDGAEPVLRLHAVALLFSFLAAPAGYALLSLRRHQRGQRRGVHDQDLAMAALAILVPVDGARGAAVATVIGEAVLAGSGALLVARSGHRLRIAKAPRIVLAAAVALAPGLVLPALPAAALGLAIFVGALLALRAVPDELLDEVRRRRAATVPPP
ncbi:MAG TPA: oligosaccharide flippase family protein [Solirubrobacteraceae bacterium]|nr:oligosaccharide flippase family protein [Solirubrobacteraceae bacterium]